MNLIRENVDLGFNNTTVSTTWDAGWHYIKVSPYSGDSSRMGTFAISFN
jgi:hypothetical protein